MWNKFAGIILRTRLPFLILIGLVTAFMGYQTQFIEMSYEMAQMLPSTDSTHIAHDEFQKKFGKTGSVMVIGANDSSLFELENFNAWYDLTHNLKGKKVRLGKKDNKETYQVVNQVLSLANAYKLEKNQKEKKFDLVPVIREKPQTQAELDSLIQELYSLPFYEGYLYNDSNSATLMALTLNRKLLDSKDRGKQVEAIMEEVEKFREKTGLDLKYSGLPYIRQNSTTKVADEIKLFILLAILVTATILYLFFRSFKATFFSMLVVGIGVVWTVGFMVLMGFKITILTGLIPPLIIVIGIPNCIFLLNKYHKEFKSHGNQIKALNRVIRKTGNAIFLTNTTTSLGFATFALTQSRILVEFGIVATIGIMTVFTLSLFLIPIIFSFLSNPKKRHTKHLENRWMSVIVETLLNIVLNHRRAVYVCTVIIVIAGFVGLSLIKTTGRIVDDLPKDDPVTQDLRFFEKHFNGVIPLEITIDTRKKGKVTRLSFLKKVDRLQDTLKTYDKLSKPISIVEGVKFARQSFYNGNESKYGLYNRHERSFLAPYLTAKSDSAGQNLLKTFVDSSKKITRVSLQMADIGTREMDKLMRDLRPKVDSIFPAEKYDITVTGTSVVFIKGTKYLVKNLMISLAIAIFLIAVIMAILFSSVRMVLVSLLPNLLPLLVTAGVMGYFGIPIKPSTILIFSVAFGISVDDTIHYLAKYRQELKLYQWNIKEAAIVALRETGISMIYTSIVLFFGFGIFATSTFGGTVALGLLVSITLLVAMLANLVLLPSLLLSFEKWLTTKAFEKEPMVEIVDEEEDIDLNELEIKRAQNETEEEPKSI